MDDNHKTPIPPRDPVDIPPEADVADLPSEVDDPDEIGQEGDEFTKSSVDEALRFMKTVWIVDLIRN